ncbi:MAG: hypothetical protein ACFBSF_12360 [Leptolyngbyaceae cyanobacterium]
MNQITQFVSSLSDQKRVELEMLYAILLDETAYPWNPADAACLDRLEAALEPVSSSQSIASQWGCLLQQAEQLWNAESL